MKMPRTLKVGMMLANKDRRVLHYYLVVAVERDVVHLIYSSLTLAAPEPGMLSRVAPLSDHVSTCMTNPHLERIA